jgi:photosystem II stability/assembly factor-like uncharacterized protein
VGFEGTILHTTNGGQDWYHQDSGDSANAITGVCALSVDTCLAVGTGMLLLRTTNAGLTWVRGTFNNIQFDTFWRPQSIRFATNLVGWVSGYYAPDILTDSSFILKTTDGGVTWGKQYLDRRCSAMRLDVLDQEKAWVCCSRYLFRTVDGERWDRVVSAYFQDRIEDVDFVTPDIGWVTVAHWDGSGEITRTNDGGSTFSPPQIMYYYTNSYLYTSFVDTSKGWFIGFNGPQWQEEILNTTDGGNSWILQDSSLTIQNQPRQMYFLDTTLGWIVGVNGSIYHTTDGGVTSIESSVQRTEGHKITLDINLDRQQRTLNLEYTLPNSSAISIIIYDLLGKEIHRRDYGRFAAGSHRLALDLASLSMNSRSTGVYLIRLTTEDAAISKSFLYIK